jgi:hypothetical protein
MIKFNIRFCYIFLLKLAVVVSALPGLISLSCQVKPGVGSTGTGIIVQAQPMDRWIDVSWNYESQPAGGFDIEVSSDGRIFKVAEHAGADARSTSIYVAESASDYSVKKLYLRVTGLNAAGKPQAKSKVISVRSAKARDIETELRKRFDYPEEGRPYNFNDPAYPVIYTEAEKEKQRSDAVAMISELENAAYSNPTPGYYEIPSGLYRIEVGQIRLSDVQDFTIYGSDVQFIIDSDESGAAFTFNNCSNITLTGRSKKHYHDDNSFLQFDSQQLPMSMSKIISVNASASTIDVEILPGYSTKLPDSERMLAYDIAGNMISIKQMKWTAAESLGGRKFRLTSKSVSDSLLRKLIFNNGTLLALHNDPAHKTHAHTIFKNNDCHNMTFEAIRVVNGGGQFSDHGTSGYTIFRDWRNYPLPGTSRLPITSGVGQFSKYGGTFLFENCEIGPHLDDGINLMSGMSIVGKSDGTDHIVITGKQKPTEGSVLTFYDFHSWEQLGAVKVISSEAINDTLTMKAVNDFAKERRIRENARSAFLTIIDKNLSLPKYAMVVHSDYRADSVIVRECIFRDQNAQILLLQGATYGLIESNLLLRSTSGAVSPQFSQYWWEGPMPSNFMIRNNVIKDNPVSQAVNGFEQSASISIYAGAKPPTCARLLKNFRIEGNTIINPSVYGISVRNAENVRIRHNLIINPGAAELTGSFRGKDVQDLYAAIFLDAASNIEISDNEIVFKNERCKKGILMGAFCDTEDVIYERNVEIDSTRRE